MQPQDLYCTNNTIMTNKRERRDEKKKLHVHFIIFFYTMTLYATGKA